MADFSLRPALEADFPAIQVLIRAAGINPTGLNWQRFTVAETSDGQFAGCGQLKPHSDGSLELASLAVIPSQRGKGLARLLIHQLAATAPRPLYLTCRSQLGPFYEKFGFRPVSGDELPKYFRRISRLAGLINALHIIQDSMLVMRLDEEAR
ncbi:MAG: GNAT family N-acetyltransferase [Chloroflexi bacterium]|nr:GNAT family N-acetyltransferase [Chloroflexota bacterium]